MKKSLILSIALLALSACQEAPTAYTPTPFAFENSVAPTPVKLGKIDVVNHFQSPMKRPHIEQDMRVSPEKAIEAWLDHRLRAAGGAGRFEVTINDASVVETPLKKTEGVKGFFTDDQDARYDAHISVTFRAYDGSSNAAKAVADVEVKRFITIHEKATVFERQQRYHEMLQAMMVDFDREANARFAQYFGGYVER